MWGYEDVDGEMKDEYAMNSYDESDSTGGGSNQLDEYEFVL
tara:strand:- start:291 stop:413 length:123 start_codon:yes stop_codon:yes gene_type:complete